MKKFLIVAAAIAASFALTPSAAAGEDRTAVDLSSCITSTTGIGSTTYHNICDGTSRVISWGAGGWLGFLFLAGIAFVFAFFVYATVRELTR